MSLSDLRHKRRGLRRQWRVAFLVMISTLLLVLGGATATYLAMAAGYRSAAHHLDNAISQTSSLNNATDDHEIASHQLWQGTPIDRAAYLAQQQTITKLFTISLRELQGPGEHGLLVHALSAWRRALTSRGLWGPHAGARPGGVTGAMQQQYGAAADEVYLTFDQLSKVAIHDGAHDLAAADRFPVVGIILLVAAFALMLATMLHFARRLTQDVVRPVETLQAATDRLNEMARALSESDAGALTRTAVARNRTFVHLRGVYLICGCRGVRCLPMDTACFTAWGPC